MLFMKKIILFLFSLLTISIITSCFFDVSLFQRSNYASTLRSLTSKENLITEYDIGLFDPKEEDSIGAVITEILEQTHSIGAVYNDIDSSTQTMVYQSFIYLPDNPVLDQLFLTEKQTVRFSDLKKGYLTSDRTDSNALGHLDFTDRFNQNPESILIQIYPLDSPKFKDYCSDRSTAALYVTGNNGQEVQSLLEQAGLKVIGVFEHENTLEPQKNAMTDLLPYVLFIALGACACMIINETKQIRILAVQGLGSVQIFCTLFLKYYLLMAAVCTGLTCLSYLFLANDFRPVNALFLKETVKILILLTALILIIAICTWLYILLFITGMKKDQKRSERLSGVMIAVQLICLIGLVPVMETSFWQFSYYWKRTDTLIQNEDTYLAYKSIGGLSSLDNEQQEEMTEIIRQAGVIYQRVSEIPAEYLDPDYSTLAAMGFISSFRLMEVNQNWVNATGFNNVLIDLPDPEPDANYVLIPENRKESTAEMLSTLPKAVPVYYRQGQRVQNLNFGGRDLILTDPVILVLSEWEPGNPGVGFSGMGSYYLPADSPKLIWLSEQFRENGLDNLWVDRVSLFHLTLNAAQTSVEEQGMRFLLTMMILIVLLYSVIRIYLVENERFSFVRTISGELFEEALVIFMKRSGLSYPIAVIWFVITHQYRTYTLLWMVLLFLFEIILFRVMYRRWQKKELQMLLREE